MPAGRVDAHVIQALAWDRMAALFEVLKKNYDVILIDSSPVLPLGHALLLGRHVEAAILAVRGRASRAVAVCTACDQLAAQGIPVLGAVFLGERPGPYGYAPSQPLQVQRYSPLEPAAAGSPADRGRPGVSFRGVAAGSPTAESGAVR